LTRKDNKNLLINGKIYLISSNYYPAVTRIVNKGNFAFRVFIAWQFNAANQCSGDGSGWGQTVPQLNLLQGGIKQS
jgi:hypothetical protein